MHKHMHLSNTFLSGEKKQKFLVINMVIGNIVEMRVHQGTQL